MNKQQLACEAILYLEEHPEIAEEAKKRMYHNLNNDFGRNTIISEDGGRVKSILSKKFGVSTGYIGKAKHLYLNDRELFQQVLAGKASLPGNKPIKKDVGTESFALYRAYDSSGRLLYIGKTWSVGQRFADHAHNSKWWDEIETMTVDRRFKSYEELTQAETLAIRNERPIVNFTPIDER
jgi:hypothetical protein